MINYKLLNSIKYIKEKQAALIIARRTAPEEKQQALNLELEIIYDAKYKILKGENYDNRRSYE